MAKKPGPQCLIAIGIVALLALLVGFVVVPAVKDAMNKNPASAAAGAAVQGAKPGTAGTAASQIAAGSTVLPPVKSVSLEFSRKSNATGTDQLAEWRNQFTLLKNLTPIVLTVSDKITTSKAKEFLIEPYTFRATGTVTPGEKKELTEFAAPTATINGTVTGLSVSPTVSNNEKAMYHSLSIDTSATDLAELKESGFAEAILVVTYSGLNAWSFESPNKMPEGTTFDQQNGNLVFRIPLIIAYNPCKTSEEELLPFDDALTAIVDCYATQAQIENAKYHEDYWANKTKINSRITDLFQDNDKKIEKSAVNVPYLKELLGAFDAFNENGTEKIPAYSNLWGTNSPIKKENDYYTINTNDGKTVYLGRSALAVFLLNKETDAQLKDLIAAKDLKNNAFNSIFLARAINEKLLSVLGKNLDIMTSQAASTTETQKLTMTQTMSNKNASFLVNTMTLLKKDNDVLAIPFNEKARAEYVDAIMKVVPSGDRQKYLDALNTKYGTKADLIEKFTAEKTRIERQYDFLETDRKKSNAWDKTLNIKQSTNSLKYMDWTGVTVTKDSDLSIELTDKQKILKEQAESIGDLIDFLKLDRSDGASFYGYYWVAYAEKDAAKKAKMLAAFDNPVVKAELDARFFVAETGQYKGLEDAKAKEISDSEAIKEKSFLYAEKIIRDISNDTSANDALVSALSGDYLTDDKSKFLFYDKTKDLVLAQNKAIVDKLKDNKEFGMWDFSSTPTFEDKSSSLILESIALQKYFHQKSFYKLAFLKGIDTELNYPRDSEDSVELQKARAESEALTKQIAAHFTKAMNDLLKYKDTTMKITEQPAGTPTKAATVETQLGVQGNTKDGIFSSASFSRNGLDKQPVKAEEANQIKVNSDDDKKVYGTTTVYITLDSESFGYLANFFKLNLTENEDGSLTAGMFVYYDSSQKDPYTKFGEQDFKTTNGTKEVSGKYCFAGKDIKSSFFCFEATWNTETNIFTVKSIETNNAMKMSGISVTSRFNLLSPPTPQSKTFDEYITTFGTKYYESFKGTTTTAGIQEKAKDPATKIVGKPDPKLLVDFAGITYSERIPNLAIKDNVSSIRGIIFASANTNPTSITPEISRIYDKLGKDAFKTYKGIVFSYSEFFAFNVETQVATINPNFASGKITENVLYGNSGARDVPRFIKENIDKIVKLASPNLLTFQANKPEQLTIADSAKCFVDVLEAKTDNSCNILEKLKKTPTQVMQDKTQQITKEVSDQAITITDKECNQSGKCVVTLNIVRDFGVVAGNIKRLALQGGSGVGTLVTTTTGDMTSNVKELTIASGAESAYDLSSIKLGQGSADNYILTQKPIVIFIEDSKQSTTKQSANAAASTVDIRVYDTLKPLTFVAQNGKDIQTLNTNLAENKTGTATTKPAEQPKPTGPKISIVSPTGNVTVKVGETVDLQGKLDGGETGKDYGYLWALAPTTGDVLSFTGMDSLNPGKVTMEKEGTFNVSLGLYEKVEGISRKQIANSFEQQITITVTKTATAAVTPKVTVEIIPEFEIVTGTNPLPVKFKINGIDSPQKINWSWYKANVNPESGLVVIAEAKKIGETVFGTINDGEISYFSNLTPIPQGDAGELEKGVDGYYHFNYPAPTNKDGQTVSWESVVGEGGQVQIRAYYPDLVTTPVFVKKKG